MDKLFIMVVILVVIFLFVIISNFSKKKEQQVKKDFNYDAFFPYTQKWDFMTPAELSFYKQLETTVDQSKYYIVP